MLLFINKTRLNELESIARRGTLEMWYQEEFDELRELVARKNYGNKEECVKYDVKEGRFRQTIRAEDSKAR